MITATLQCNVNKVLAYRLIQVQPPVQEDSGTRRSVVVVQSPSGFIIIRTLVINVIKFPLTVPKLLLPLLFPLFFKSLAVIN